ncbi:hypothetical protein DFH07DRAFT_59316 [Mycena maculata]|uniref:Uncharacterized protein n=1 Tax=Mycena maculata TaxID=230809 RepID=A0AAD7N186_9AGAR|nr:hypothetical protein DFH07DRAFT_59316 [Mycena maculata]
MCMWATLTLCQLWDGPYFHVGPASSFAASSCAACSSSFAACNSDRRDATSSLIHTRSSSHATRSVADCTRSLSTARLSARHVCCSSTCIPAASASSVSSCSSSFAARTSRCPCNMSSRAVPSAFASSYAPASVVFSLDARTSLRALASLSWRARSTLGSARSSSMDVLIECSTLEAVAFVGVDSGSVATCVRADWGVVRRRSWRSGAATAVTKPDAVGLPGAEEGTCETPAEGLRAVETDGASCVRADWGAVGRVWRWVLALGAAAMAPDAVRLPGADVGTPAESLRAVEMVGALAPWAVVRAARR